MYICVTYSGLHVFLCNLPEQQLDWIEIINKKYNKTAFRNYSNSNTNIHVLCIAILSHQRNIGPSWDTKLNSFFHKACWVRRAHALLYPKRR